MKDLSKEDQERIEKAAIDHGTAYSGAFEAGAKYEHPIAYNQGLEDGAGYFNNEAYNQAIEDARKLVWQSRFKASASIAELVEELENLKKS
jgi:uncharacterized protein (DUF2164 family)